MHRRLLALLEPATRGWQLTAGLGLRRCLGLLNKGPVDGGRVGDLAPGTPALFCRGGAGFACAIVNQISKASASSAQRHAA